MKTLHSEKIITFKQSDIFPSLQLNLVTKNKNMFKFIINWILINLTSSFINIMYRLICTKI